LTRKLIFEKLTATELKHIFQNNPDNYFPHHPKDPKMRPSSTATSAIVCLLVRLSVSRAFQSPMSSSLTLVGSSCLLRRNQGDRPCLSACSTWPPKQNRQSRGKQVTKDLGMPLNLSTERHWRNKIFMPRHSARFGFLDMDGDESSRDDAILSYLPNNSAKDLPPETRALLRKITTQYTYGRAMVDYTVTLDNIFGVIEDEYVVWDVPVMVNGVEVHSSTGQKNKEDKRGQVLSRLLSFAVLNQIPAELICEVLSSALIKEEGPLYMAREALANSGWKGVSFPKGLGLRLKQNLQTSSQQISQPPRFATRSKRQKFAKELVLSASNISAPAKMETSREAFLRQLTEDSSDKTAKASSRKLQLRKNTGLLFFPEKGTIEKFRNFFKKQSVALSRAGKGGALAYGFLNFALYAGGTIWQWRSITVAANPGVTSAQLFRSQLTKLGRVLGTVYIGSQVTKLPRILLAIALAPTGEKALDIAQKRLKVSENTAFAILTVMLISTFISVLAFLTVGSTAASSYPDISSGFERLRQFNNKKDVWA
jgi:hypothetical protein